MGFRDAFQPLLARAERALSDGVERARAAFASAERVPTAAKLLTEQGAPTLTGVRTPTRIGQADNLSPERLGSLLRTADMGNVEAYLTLAEEIEERDAHYRSVLSTRKLAVSGAPPLVESASDSAHDKAIAEDVENTIVRQAEFEGLVTDLMDAPAKGFSNVEILWERTVKRWQPERYAHRPARHFLFDEASLERPLLRSVEKPLGEELTPYSWIVHKPRLMSGVPIRAGLARPVAWCYCAKHFTITDWLAFIDVYGMPIRVGKYPANMESKKKELLKAVRAIGSDAAGVIPIEMAIELLEVKGQGAELFENTARFFNQEISKVVLGQTMTAEDGSSLAQAQVHQRVRFDIRDADARAVSASINRDLIKPFVILNYGVQEVYPKVVIKTVEKEDTKALMETTKVFVSLGGKVQMTEVRDRLGFAEPEEGAELLEPESAISAKYAPKPAPLPPGAPGTPGSAPPKQPPGSKASKENQPEPGEEPDEPDEEEREANRQRFAKLQGTEDVVDEQADAALDDWRPLLDENVGALIARAQAAESYDEAMALLARLREDAGDELALGLITAQLARATFRVRGVGDATDRTEGV